MLLNITHEISQIAIEFENLRPVSHNTEDIKLDICEFLLLNIDREISLITMKYENTAPQFILEILSSNTISS